MRLAAATALAQVVDALGVDRVPFIIQRLTRAALSRTEPDECGDIIAKKGDEVLAAGASERSGAAQAGAGRWATPPSQSLPSTKNVAIAGPTSSTIAK